MNKNLMNIVNTIVTEGANREAAIAEANREIKAAKEALHEAYMKRREAKGCARVNWKQYAENMAALLNELPEGKKFTPTQLAHIYSLAYPEDKNVGTLHIYPIADTHRILNSIKVKVKGLVDLGNDSKTLYARSGKAEVVCK